MSIGSAAAASIGGMWDVFDRCVAVINHQIARLNEMDHEDADSMVDYTMVEGELVELGSREESLEMLESAIADLDNIRLLCQRVEASIP
jgi:hypothetical protein